jgi:pimeloyl-ACP methyl ester carboxylesterase
MVPVAELLGLYHRFYAPDLPSFGKSEKFSTASGEAFELSWLSWGVEVDRNGQHEIAVTKSPGAASRLSSLSVATSTF